MRTISLLLPTIGRPTLARSLASLADQTWIPDDEILVLSDDAHDVVGRIIHDSPVGSLVRHVRVPGGPHRDWGHTPRNLCMRESRGDYLMHLDDDDILCPYAVANIRDQLHGAPSSHMFRFVRYTDGFLVWTDSGKIELGHVGTACFVHPNNPVTFGSWGPTHEGDFDFINHVCRQLPVVWHDVITSVVDATPEMDTNQARIGIVNGLGGRPVGWRRTL